VSRSVAVLGVGAVGGALAARLASAGVRVTCVCAPGTAAAIREGGLEVETPEGVLRARPEVAESLREAVSLLVVAVKAPSLEEALLRIEPQAVADGVVVPLLNGLEHPAAVRARVGPRVAPGTIARFSGELTGPGRVLERSGVPLVTVASGDLGRGAVEEALRPLADSGVEVVVAGDERAVLWEKVARLGPLAAATVASGLAVGPLRADPGWRARLADAIDEAVAIAAADGVALHAADEWAIIDAMPPDATTSAALDVARGRPSELDAIAGSVLRAAERHGLRCPGLAALVERAERRR